MEWLPVAQADTGEKFGPFMPYFRLICPGARLMMRLGMKNGPIFFTPFAMSVPCSSSIVPRPPMPAPTMQPTRSASSFAMSRPASFTAMPAAASAKWMNRSLRRTSLRSMNCAASNPFTSPAMRVGYVEASNSVIGPIPLLPATSADQDSSTPIPTGETSPRPVTTTRRLLIGSPLRGTDIRGGEAPRPRPRTARATRPRTRGPGALRLLLVGRDVRHRVLDGLDVLRLLVRDLDLELLLHRHHELDDVEGVRAEVVDERGRDLDLLLADAQLVRNDVPHLLLDGSRHAVPPPWLGGSKPCREAPRLHVHPAVDPQDLAGHVRCLIAREKSHRVRDVLRRAKTCERNHFHHLRLAGLGEPGRHVGLDVPRRHRVHADVAGGELPRDRLREPDLPRLRRRVRSLAGVPHLADDRRDVHDRAAARLHHRPRHGADEVEVAGEVHLDRPVPVVVLDPHDELIERDPCVVHEHVQAAEVGDDALDGGGAGGRVRHVELVELRLGRAGLLHERERLVRGGRVASVVQGDARAAPREGDRDRAADTARGAGDEDGLALEVEGHGDLLSSERGEGLLERGAVFHVPHLDGFVDPLREAREHLPGAHLYHPRDALADERLDALDPADRRGHLLDEERDDARDVGVRLRLDVRDDRASERLPGERTEHRLEPAAHRRHERTVEGGGDGERQHALRAGLLELHPGLLHRARGAGDDGLRRVVVVRRGHDLARLGRDRRADLPDLVRREPEDGAHRALPLRHRLLHERAARPHGLRRVRRGAGARRDERGVLAERVSRDEVRDDPSLGEDRRRSRRDGQDRGLRVRGELQGLLRPLEAHPRQLLAERRVDLLEHGARLGEPVEEFLTHPDRLRALAGEDERELAHRRRLRHQRRTLAPHAIPPPIAIMRITSPGENQPARFASSSVIGTLAADVLPYFSRFIQHFDAGISSRCSVASRIRLFAWWAMTYFTSPGASFSAASTSRQLSSRARTATLKTSAPFIFTKWVRSRTTFSEIGSFEPPPGWSRIGTYEPSAWRRVVRSPRRGSSVGFSTIAPAPSPKRMQVFRSVQSVRRVSASAPTTSSFFTAPDAMNRSATASA